MQTESKVCLGHIVHFLPQFPVIIAKYSDAVKTLLRF